MRSFRQSVSGFTLRHRIELISSVSACFGTDLAVADDPVINDMRGGIQQLGTCRSIPKFLQC